MSTAAIIIIGDEILANKFQDENTPFLLQRCAELNIAVDSVSIIPDVLDRIANVVRTESQRCTYVFTTGGVGPTHDDITFEGVAKAFDSQLYRNPELSALIESYMESPTDAAYRMAEVPIETELLPTDRGYPQVRVRNVYIFPGVPKLLRSKFQAIEHLLQGEVVFRDTVALDVRETFIAESLTALDRATPTVKIGSYPRFNESPSLIITLESSSATELATVKDMVESKFAMYLHQNKDS